MSLQPSGASTPGPTSHSTGVPVQSVTEPRVSHQFGDVPQPRPTGIDDEDPTTDAQTHVIYFVPADQTDLGLDTDGTLARAIEGIRGWFGRETSKEGLPAIRPRFDRLIGGGWDITNVTAPLPAAEYTLGAIAEELAAQGFNKSNKRYLVFAEVRRDATGNPGGRCGESYYGLPVIDSPRVAVVYLGANEGCGARAVGGGSAGTAGKSEAIAVHEWLHLEGFMPLASRHHCPTSLYHACTGALWMVPPMTEPAEVPRLDPEAPDILFPLIHQPLSDAVLDRNRDDYLDHDLPWNDLRDSAWME